MNLPKKKYVWSEGLYSLQTKIPPGESIKYSVLDSEGMALTAKIIRELIDHAGVIYHTSTKLRKEDYDRLLKMMEKGDKLCNYLEK